MMNRSTNLESMYQGLTCVFMIMLLLFGWITTAYGEKGKININQLVSETQKMSEKTDEMTLVWWVPKEYWRVSFEQAEMGADDIGDFLNSVSPYLVFAVVDGKMGMFGGVTYKSEQDIRASISMVDSKGNLYEPLTSSEIDADVNNILSMMKPIFASLLGPMGENMHFYLFPAKNKSGSNIAEADKAGSLIIELAEREFKWRLPLGSLLPPKICATCGEKLSGAYKYCPWDGTRLP